jgi:class 3 adenylate cyclase
MFDYSVVSKAFEQYAELQRSTAASLGSVLDSFKWLQAPSGKGRDEELEKLRKEFENYKEQVKRQHIYTRLDPEGQTKYFEDMSFRKLFDSRGDVQAAILSMDIRKSTDLMLHAREPKLFSDFVIGLIYELQAILKRNYGIYDKFTGDGVVAVFPEFYSGSDYVYYAINCALECCKMFDEYYKTNRKCFSIISNESYLRIGLDQGPVYINSLSNEFTAVGRTVVYACRLSSVDEERILLNSPMAESVLDRYPTLFSIIEKEVIIKHEGKVAAFEIERTLAEYQPSKPKWILSG